MHTDTLFVVPLMYYRPVSEERSIIQHRHLSESSSNMKRGVREVCTTGTRGFERSLHSICAPSKLRTVRQVATASQTAAAAAVAVERGTRRRQGRAVGGSPDNGAPRPTRRP